MKFECAYDELVALNKLVEHPRNANKHPERQIDLLAKIIDYQGQRAPIVVSNRSGFIVKGHGRLEALKRLGWDQAAVDFQDYESEAQEFADLIADNKIAELAQHDDNMMIDGIKELDIKDFELLGLDGFDLPDAPFEAQSDEDEIPENVDTRVKPGDIWQLGKHRLMCGDSTNIQAVEALMDGAKADMVYTDPPYGIDEETDRAFASRTRKAKGNTFSKILGDDSIDTALAAFSICDSLSKTVCYWGGNYYAHKIPASPCWIVWDKRVDENQRNMNSDCELAYVKHPSKKSVRIFRHLWKGMIKGSEHGQGRNHPTQKPIALAEWCFNELAEKAKTILDLFGGSGSTLIACEKTRRQCFMMELDPHYCDVILSRWEKYTGKTAKRLTEGSDDLDEVLNG